MIPSHQLSLFRIHRFGGVFISPSTFVGQAYLTGCAITRSLTDGCLQAHCTVVIDTLILSTEHSLGTLSNGLGCFPLDDGAYPSPSRYGVVFVDVFAVHKNLVQFDPPAVLWSSTPFTLSAMLHLNAFRRKPAITQFD